MSIVLGKPFSECTRDDIEGLMVEIGQRDYAEWTKADYRIILKRFYKWLLGNNEEFPIQVKWIRYREPKNTILPEELLTEEEVLRVVDKTKLIRDKAFIYLLYESGARIGEILTLSIKHVTIGNPISSILVSGKTGQRRILFV
ncbi:MAG: tyrosine-type recombinase/integrase, partial [archaeon]